jgi:hypothetical protein
MAVLSKLVYTPKGFLLSIVSQLVVRSRLGFSAQALLNHRLEPMAQLLQTIASEPCCTLQIDHPERLVCPVLHVENAGFGIGGDH